MVLNSLNKNHHKNIFKKCFLVYINMEQIIEELSKYEKQKDSIYKWRNNNRQKYLKYSSQYNINNYKNLDPEKKRELIEKTKANVKARRAK